MERNEYSVALIAEKLTTQTYIEMLKKYLAFYEPLEQLIFSVTIPKGIVQLVPSDYAARRRAHMIKFDLLKQGVSTWEVESLPPCEKLPEVTSMAQALGCLYVLEGSSLGGQIILAHLKRNLNLDKNSGASFFAGSERETWHKWKVFTEFLQEFGLLFPEAEEELCFAAEETFRCFDSWLTGGT